MGFPDSSMDNTLSGHTAAAVQSWAKLRSLKLFGKGAAVHQSPDAVSPPGPTPAPTPTHPPGLTRSLGHVVSLDGHSLDMAVVVAVAHHGVVPSISDAPDLADRIARSVDGLDGALARGWVIYGVNTGFGGSADVRVRTAAMRDLQISLMQHLQSGIIPAADLTSNPDRLPLHTIPRPWVRAAILIRANQNLRGHSAVRLQVIDRLLDLLVHDITPIIPLRGTISASGDLMPMSYIVGAITGNPDVFVQLGPACGNAIVPAPDALLRYHLDPVVLQPKEGLGLVNGTAPSAALASLVLFDTQQLAVLTQALTALTSECLAGNVEWADPFVHLTRPHPGQAEVAANICAFLHGSRLVTGLEAHTYRANGLCQDRYSTRTAAQWIGPYLEDLQLAQRQVEVELNSTCDNPLVSTLPRPIDTESNAGTDAGAVIFNGGNFQAATVTSAMEKARLAVQMLGRILFSQLSELINPATNNGLDANLNAVDDRAFTMKGIDVNVTAYMSELASLAHPVSAHVLSAEMHNQGVNSLAFLSARRTFDAVDLLAHICACHLYVACQAVELRVMHEAFLHSVAPSSSLSSSYYPAAGSVLLPALRSTLSLSAEQADRLQAQLSPLIRQRWYDANRVPARQRCALVADALVAPALHFLIDERLDRPAADLARLRTVLAAELDAAAARTGPGRDTTLPSLRADVRGQLGAGSARLYCWVRDRLEVDTHMGLADDPLLAHADASASTRKTIGSLVTRIYESIRDGSLTGEVMAAVSGQ